MVATVTLNPAVDKTLFSSGVILGSVNRMDDVQNIAGGKGINVAKVLKQYDFDVITLGFIGGYNGKFIEDTVKGMNIDTKFTKVSKESRTSINLITEDGYITEFLEPGPLISEEELSSFKAEYEEVIKGVSMVVISGSVPKGVDCHIYKELILLANDMGKKVVLDTSGDALKYGIEAKPYMIKPNMRELEQLMGKKIRGMQELSDAAIELVKTGIDNVMVSMGSKGILYAKKSKDDVDAYFVPAPSIKAVNTVGSGDSAVAAFVISTLEELSNEDTVKKCVAISAANAMSVENGIIDKDIAEEFYENLAVSSAIR